MTSITRSRLRPIWDDEPSIAGKLTKAVGLVIMVLVIVFPIYVVVLTSISSGKAINEAGGLVSTGRLADGARVFLMNDGFRPGVMREYDASPDGQLGQVRGAKLPGQQADAVQHDPGRPAAVDDILERRLA